MSLFLLYCISRSYAHARVLCFQAEQVLSSRPEFDWQSQLSESDLQSHPVPVWSTVTTGPQSYWLSHSEQTVASLPSHSHVRADCHWLAVTSKLTVTSTPSLTGIGIHFPPPVWLPARVLYLYAEQVLSWIVRFYFIFFLIECQSAILIVSLWIMFCWVIIDVPLILVAKCSNQILL